MLTYTVQEVLARIVTKTCRGLHYIKQVASKVDLSIDVYLHAENQ